MNKPQRNSIFDYIEWITLSISGMAAVGYAVYATPIFFWLPAWAILAITLCNARFRGSGTHWPSTIFGIIEILYISVLLIILRINGVSYYTLGQLFWGLLFVHGLLYFSAARNFLVMTGQLKIRSKEV